MEISQRVSAADYVQESDECEHERKAQCTYHTAEGDLVACMLVIHAVVFTPLGLRVHRYSVYYTI